MKLLSLEPDGCDTSVTSQSVHTNYYVPSIQALAVAQQAPEIAGEDGTTTTEKTAKEDTGFILSNDIDFGGGSFGGDAIITIGKNSVFDGNGYHFLNFKLGGTYFGVFSFSENSVLRNLTLGSEGGLISGSGQSKNKGGGGVAATTFTTFRMENVHVFANLSTTVSNCGGLIGDLAGNATIINCSFHGTVTGTKGKVDVGYGGLILSECRQHQLRYPCGGNYRMA